MLAAVWRIRQHTLEASAESGDLRYYRSSASALKSSLRAVAYWTGRRDTRLNGNGRMRGQRHSKMRLNCAY